MQERSESFTHKPGSTTPKDLLPLFIAQDRLNDKVMRELKPIAEEWAGVRLREGQSYVRTTTQTTTTIPTPPPPPPPTPTPESITHYQVELGSACSGRMFNSSH